MEALKVSVRNARLDELPFIYSTWLRSYRHSSQFAKKISNETFYEWHHKVIDRFVDRGGVILIAHIPEEPDFICGYICVETDGSIVQYAYTRKKWRKQGIAKSLYEAAQAPAIFTHWTSDTNWLVKKLLKLNYNPYLL